MIYFKIQIDDHQRPPFLSRILLILKSLLMSIFQNVLIPTDFSPAAWNAVKYAVELGTRHNSSLTLLHVFPPIGSFSALETSHGGSDYMSIDVLKNEMDSFIQSLNRSHELSIQSAIVGGEVTNQILTFIQQHDFDLVIIGVNSHGMDNYPGSHTADILQSSGHPVLVVPNAISA